MGRGCPNNPEGHLWTGEVGEKEHCSICGVVNGGRRVSRATFDDPAPPCRSPAGHRWQSDVQREVRVCVRCQAALPLTGSARARARRVKRIAARDGWCCFYCTIPFSDTNPPTEDHRTPRCRGGGRALSNLVLACFWCNHRKADGTEWQLRGLRQFRERTVWVQRRFYRESA